MKAVNFEGQTHTLGENQGYQILPVRVDDDGATRIMTSLWELSPSDVAHICKQLIYNQPIFVQVSVICDTHPPIQLTCAPEPAEEKVPEPAEEKVPE